VTVTLPLKRAAAEMTVSEELQEGVSASSPVDFWQQINNDDADGSANTASTSDSNGGCSNDEKLSGAVSLPEKLLEKSLGANCLPDDEAIGDCRQPSDRDDDADSGIITITSSADTASRPNLDKDTIGGGRTRGVVGSKKYQRTCTHSRLFDFLQHNDDDDDDNVDGADFSNDTDAKNEPPPPPLSLSYTSGYSSAATTPSTPSIVGRSRNYESDSARTEYDSYYKSWEYACPYFGYDILPSKAFKTIATQLQGGGGSAVNCKSTTTTTTKFKCPKIPTEKDES